MAQSTEPPADGPELAVEGLGYVDVGIRLRELSDQLRALSDLIIDEKLDENERRAYEFGVIEAIEDNEVERLSRFRRTLSGLGTYRRNYHYWERVIAEYALTEMKYTQRDTAHLLGVGLSTINRWAQNPVRLEN